MSSWLPDAKVGLRVRASKGVHLVVPRSAITGEVGLILRTPKSVLFVIPWGGHWIIGTTDTEWTFDRSHPAASAKDIDYLLDQVNQVLERPLTTADIEGVYAGLRPLLSGEEETTSALSREHAVVEPLLGLLLVAGGKFTTYRVMAQDVVDRAARRLPGTRPSATDELPLLGADGFQALWRDRADLARRHGVSVGVDRAPAGALRHADHRAARADRRATGAGRGAARRPGICRGRGRLRGARRRRPPSGRRARPAHPDLDGDRRTAGWRPPAAPPSCSPSSWAGRPSTTEEEIKAYLARVDAERESQRMPDDLTADAARTAIPAPAKASRG